MTSPTDLGVQLIVEGSSLATHARLLTISSHRSVTLFVVTESKHPVRSVMMEMTALSMDAHLIVRLSQVGLSILSLISHQETLTPPMSLFVVTPKLFKVRSVMRDQTALAAKLGATITAMELSMDGRVRVATPTVLQRAQTCVGTARYPPTIV